MHATDRAFPALEGLELIPDRKQLEWSELLTLAGREPSEESSSTLDPVDAYESVRGEKGTKLVLIPKVDVPFPRVLRAVGNCDRDASARSAKPAKSING